MRSPSPTSTLRPPSSSPSFSWPDGSPAGSRRNRRPRGFYHLADLAAGCQSRAALAVLCVKKPTLPAHGGLGLARIGLQTAAVRYAHTRSRASAEMPRVRREGESGRVDQVGGGIAEALAGTLELAEQVLSGTKVARWRLPALR